MALALAALGATSVTGIDVVPRNIVAAKAIKFQLALNADIEFHCTDVHDWVPSAPYDVIMSHEALEPSREPKEFLAQLRGLLAPAGRVVLGFGPLFFCPFGDHMDGFFRAPVPWRGVIFREAASCGCVSSDSAPRITQRTVLNDYFAGSIYAILRVA